MGEGGGQIEAELLALVALESAAAELCDELDTFTGSAYIRVAGEAEPSRASALVSFQFQYLETLKTSAKNAESKVGTKLNELQKNISEVREHFENRRDSSSNTKNDPQELPKRAALLGEFGLSAIQATANTAANISQLFATDFTVGAVEVSNYDQAFVAQLVDCLREKNEGVHFFTPGSFTGSALNGAEGKLFDEIHGKQAELVSLLQSAATFDAGMGSLNQSFDELAEEIGATDADVVTELKPALADLSTALANAKERVEEYTGVVKLYDTTLQELLSQLGKTDSAIALEKVIQSRLFAQKNFDEMLEVKIDATGGSYYTKKNIWSTLGAMPFEIAGGATVHYMVYKINADSSEDRGAIQQSGAIGIHSGYYNVNELAADADPIEECALKGDRKTRRVRRITTNCPAKGNAS